MEKETGRIEAFSDGVFAIAITLLVLDIKVPRVHELHGASLKHALLQQWPIYLAYVISFLTILIMWINHHKLFTQIRRTDHWFLLINGLLLMVVSVTPFPTALLAEHIRYPGAVLAAAVYSGFYVLLAVFFNLLWRYAAYRNRLLRPDSDQTFIRTINRQYTLGPLFYLIAFALAFVNVSASVGICLLLALFFALPTVSDSSSRSHPPR